MLNSPNNCRILITMGRQFSDLRPIVVTNCTTRKRATDPPVTLSVLARHESLPKLAKRWFAALSKMPRRTTAGELYVGRAMVESKRVARSLGADLYVVSAGLGLVHESDQVPNYDFTASASAGPLQAALDCSREPLTNWWSLLIERTATHGSLASVVRVTPDQLVLVALPASYLRLVGADLAAIGNEASQRLRIFTSEAGQAQVPECLRHCVLPYDGRLECVSGYQGTRAEFPQRALRHFVEALAGHELAAGDAHAAVTASLAGLVRRATPVRQRKSDEEITHMLRQQWASHAGSSTRLHRYLRDKAQVACEQSRFVALWRQVRAECQEREVNTHAA